MKNSIFTRYISLFLIIIMLSFLVLAFVISAMTVMYSGRTKQIVAMQTSQVISNYLTTEKQYATKEALISELKTMIDLLSRNAETLSIYVCDPHGNIAYSSDKFEGNIADESVIALGNSAEGGTAESDLGGHFKTKHSIVVTPLKNTTPDSVGILLVCYDARTVNRLTIDSVRTIIVASIIVMVIVMASVYILTERIVSPLRKMTVATKKFAQGKFDTRLPVKGNDEIAQLSMAFNSMAESLAGMEYSRSAFLANVSHDLRTPMTTITGYIDGILDGAIPPEKQSYYLDIVASETRRLSRLVSQLLDISKIESGNRKFEKSTFDICEMARITLISLESRINDKKLNVEFDCDKDRTFIESDKDAINQVLYNLCDNAVKFSKEGGTFRLGITCSHEKVTVCVYNEGVGISEEDLPHIFDRFYKSDKSRGLDKTGVGLGLYISKTIMDNLEHSMSVESKLGEYCKFTLVFDETIPEASVTDSPKTDIGQEENND